MSVGRPAHESGVPLERSSLYPGPYPIVVGGGTGRHRPESDFLTRCVACFAGDRAGRRGRDVGCGHGPGTRTRRAAAASAAAAALVPKQNTTIKRHRRIVGPRQPPDTRCDRRSGLSSLCRRCNVAAASAPTRKTAKNLDATFMKQEEARHLGWDELGTVRGEYEGSKRRTGVKLSRSSWMYWGRTSRPT